jgi:hypothetical protein
MFYGNGDGIWCRRTIGFPIPAIWRNGPIGSENLIQALVILSKAILCLQESKLAECALAVNCRPQPKKGPLARPFSVFQRSAEAQRPRSRLVLASTRVCGACGAGWGAVAQAARTAARTAAMVMLRIDVSPESVREWGCPHRLRRMGRKIKLCIAFPANTGA